MPLSPYFPLAVTEDAGIDRHRRPLTRGVPLPRAPCMTSRRSVCSSRTFIFESGTIGNTHFVAIPFNAKAKAGALVLANLMLDPEAQYEKAKPDVWGDATALDRDRLPAEWKDAFASLPRHAATLSPEVLRAHRLPELEAGWLIAVEDGWRKAVLGR